ncbi:ankyrin repeat domain-containing protein [Rhizobium sp. 007]|uniref:ankyrin repeat domain-containing protein n=1 Tax=Rhizobium sp. 007 TaxID=2785056 RepID=UPI00188FB004|nr:ankyrin repeat domain-containing protein [Rhizobium sp. 007]QPB24405.1 ankyrin repeat domain-containing protein [Rhizobium sp. 007]
MLDAASSADSKKFFAVLDEIGDPNITDATGDMALEWIATSDNTLYPFLEREGLRGDGHEVRENACQIWLSTRLEMAEELLKRGALVDGPRGGSRWTPLMNAIIAHDPCDNTPMVKMLLKHGAKSNRINVSRLPGSEYAKTTTPLTMAAEDGRPETVTALLEGGAEPELTSDSWAGDDLTPLFAIALNNNPNHNAGPLGDFSDDAYDSSCDRADSALVSKFKLLLTVSNLDRELMPRTDYRTKDFVGITVEKVLEHRLGGGCTFSDCNGSGRVAEGRCLERMLGALLDFRKTR